MTRSIGNRFRNFVINCPILICLIIAALTGLAIWPTSVVPTQTSMLHSFSDDPRALDEFRAKAEQLGGSGDSMILVATREKDGVFRMPVLRAIRSAAEELTQVKDIDKVYTITDVPLLREVDHKTDLRNRIRNGEIPDASELPQYDLWSGSESGQQNPLRDNFKQWILENRLRPLLLEQTQLGGSLVSRDGESQCMVIKLKESSLIDLSSRETIDEIISEVVGKHGLGTEELHICGVMATEGRMIAEMNRALVELFPLGALLIVLFVLALFNRFITVFITLLIGVIAIIWCLGITALTFGEITFLVKAVPILILAISTSDTIHLLTTYYHERKQGSDKKEALHTMLKEVGSACLLTSITTLIGFGSLILVPTTAVKHIALAAGTGTAAALLLAICLVPIILMSLRKDRPVLPFHFDAVNRFIRWITMLCCRVSLRYPLTCVITFVVLGAGAIMAGWNLPIDANYPKRFPSGHPVRESVEFFDAQFNGTTTIEIIFEGDRDSILAPSTLEYLRTIEGELSEKEGVRKVASLVDVFDQVDRIVGFDNEAKLPDDPAHAANLMEFVRGVDRGLVDSILSGDNTLTRVSVQVIPTRFNEILTLSNQIEAYLGKEELPGNLSVEVTGSYPLIARSFSKIVDGQNLSFLTCFLLVTVIVSVGLRSFKLSMLGLLPNLVPLVFLLGLLGLCYEYIDPAFLMIFTVCFAISVDGTIHFLNRLRIEQERTPDLPTALEATFQHAGTPIVRTTIVLVVGLLPLALAQYLVIWMMGSFLVFGLICALLADLVLLPALIALSHRKSGKNR